MTKKQLDFPFDDIVRNCTQLVASGADIYQKFTCSNCGVRLGMDEPNILYTHGHCSDCGALTNIRTRGCNYLLLSPGKSERRQLEVHVATPDAVSSKERKN